MRRFFRFVLRTLILIVVFLAAFLISIRLAIHGRMQTTVPKIIRLAQSQAEKSLGDHGLVLDQGDRYFSSDVPPGRRDVAGWNPGRRGWHVRVAESMGPTARGNSQPHR